MQIESVAKNDYQILRIQEDLNFNSDLTKLRDIVEELLNKDKVNIAVSLTPKSYLSSMSIGYLLSLYKMIKAKEGNLAVIQPNEEDSDLLEMLSMTSVIQTYDSEDALFNSNK